MRYLPAMLLAAALAGIGSAPSFAASLIGSTIETHYSYPDTASIYPFSSVSINPFVVGAGVDTVINVEDVTFLDIDFSVDTLVVKLNTVLAAPTWNGASQNGPFFTVQSGDSIAGIDSIASTLSGPVTAFLQSGALFINWAGASYVDGDTVTLRFTLRDAAAEFATPLPGALPLFASVVGLAALAYRRRMRKSTAG